MTLLRIHSRYDEYDEEAQYVEVAWGKIDLTEFPREQVIASGAATAEEFDRLYANKEDRHREHTELLEREEYERLKKKFEGE